MIFKDNQNMNFQEEFNVKSLFSMNKYLILK
jgi:hypothetical protein